MNVLDSAARPPRMNPFPCATVIRAASLASLILLLFICSTAYAGLIPCPDCGKQVSDRALMCPSCGCPAEAIRAATQANMTGKVALPSFCHSLIRVTSDQGEGAGACIQIASQLYVLTAQHLLAGAQSLSLAKMFDGEPIPYSSIELASDRNLARLAVNSTNVHPLALAQATNADLALVYVATNTSVIIIHPGQANNPLPAGTPLLDAATNLVMVLGATGGKQAANVASVPLWVLVQPLAYRTQTTLLQKAAKPAVDRAATVTQLQETKWLTPYLAQQAQTLITDLKQ